ncbi:hypothetical protein TIFTF001_048929 [Ficus carica]|uniref:Uncharacterized protein n=1 Tax=Ficus carica TaxID=3494 RepID=A0AA87Z9E5_FICCA|nr:hypothetical protein TIFTF001_048926 [Ficus carica]GMN21766.1 hypothetical protein TIFTF001_048927 [Ficus carica]GMN21778.1 hypothetical protein TIFTF001_048928 [Ficus carica]GMN21790.1 hypothetical protein TIFTF001_048929 [Ficus carica]
MSRAAVSSPMQSPMVEHSARTIESGADPSHATGQLASPPSNLSVASSAVALIEWWVTGFWAEENRRRSRSCGRCLAPVVDLQIEWWREHDIDAIALRVVKSHGPPNSPRPWVATAVGGVGEGEGFP